jgi:hypothetical protein
MLKHAHVATLKVADSGGVTGLLDCLADHCGVEVRLDPRLPRCQVDCRDRARIGRFYRAFHCISAAAACHGRDVEFVHRHLLSMSSLEGGVSNHGKVKEYVSISSMTVFSLSGDLSRKGGDR